MCIYTNVYRETTVKQVYLMALPDKSFPDNKNRKQKKKKVTAKICMTKKKYKFEKKDVLYWQINITGDQSRQI